MNITIPDELLKGLELSPQEATLDFAIGLFLDRRVTLGRAAEITALPQADFLKELGKRRIPVHYDMTDLESDLRTLSVLREKREAEGS